MFKEILGIKMTPFHNVSFKIFKKQLRILSYQGIQLYLIPNSPVIIIIKPLKHFNNFVTYFSYEKYTQLNELRLIHVANIGFIA